MSETPTIPPFINSTMKLMLRSPLHAAVSKSILLISFSGRKSGKTYTTPVSYSQDGELVYIFSHAAWWKNLAGGAPVTLRIRGQNYQGFAEPVAGDKQAVAAGLKMHLRKVPFDAKFYNVSLDEKGYPSAEDIEKAVQTVVMIRVRLC